MTREEIRMKLWADVFIALTAPETRYLLEDRAEAADQAIKLFDDSFPKPAPVERPTVNTSRFPDYETK